MKIADKPVMAKPTRWKKIVLFLVVGRPMGC